MSKALIRVSAVSLLVGVTPAIAADFSEANPVVSPPKAAAPAPATTFGVEFDTDIQEATGKSPAQGSVADYYGKFTLSHTFSNGWVASGFFQPQYDLHPGKTNLWRYYV